jgi:hypothetical protein
VEVMDNHFFIFWWNALSIPMALIVIVFADDDCVGDRLLRLLFCAILCGNVMVLSHLA